MIFIVNFIKGMVVCASNADHTVVKLLEPPSCANIGDRVTFDGFGGEPASASALAKKKILEKLLPEVFIRLNPTRLTHLDEDE